MLSNLPEKRQEEHAEQDRDDPDVGPERRHQAVEARARLRRLDRELDLVLDRRSRRGEHGDQVGLALIPGVVEPELLRPEAADAIRVVLEVHIGVVDEDLGDFDRVGTGIAHREVDLPGTQNGLLHGELFDGRTAALVEPGRAQDDECPEGGGNERERDKGEQPHRYLREAGAPGGSSARVHYLTAKKPIQPSSANSDLWAWNMTWPGYRKRSSQTPRCPWPWMTVSVSSVGRSDVPVG